MPINGIALQESTNKTHKLFIEIAWKINMKIGGRSAS